MKESLSFFLPFIFYIVALLYVGFRQKSNASDTEDYFLGGRAMTLPALVATLVTTWYGGILGVGQFTYLYGISNWFIFGLPYYFFAIVYALLIVPKIRQHQALSLPEMLRDTFSRKISVIGSIFVFIIISPAPYILMLALLLQFFFQIPFSISMLIGLAISIAYVWKGGFRSIVSTDKLQFIFMFAGFMILIAYAMRELSIVHLWQSLPEGHKNPTGGMSWQQLVVWFLIASWTFIDPGFHQRVMAAKNTQTARRAILTSVGFWFFFDLLTMTSGLYAVVLLPGLTDAQTAFPALAGHLLPPFVKGVFFCGLLATVMSTIDSFTFLSAITLGNDIAGAFKSGNDQATINRYVKIGLLITAGVSILLIYLFPSIIDLWYNIGTLTLPPMLPALLSAYFKRLRIPNFATLTVMILSFIISAGWFTTGQIKAVDGWAQYPMGIEPFFPGLVFGIVIYAAYHTISRLKSH